MPVYKDKPNNRPRIAMSSGSSIVCTNPNACVLSNVADVATLPYVNSATLAAAGRGQGLVNVDGMLVRGGISQSGGAGCSGSSGASASGYKLATMGAPATGCAAFPLVCSENQQYTASGPAGYSCALSLAGLSGYPRL
jgi:hypothetical protein